MLDSEIVAAIVAGDADGLAAAYDRYAAPLYGFCCSLLSEPGDAADVVQDTFVIASAKLDGLRDPELLRSWLFAVARNDCHRRLRARTGTGSPDGTREVTDGTVDLADLERAEVREVVGLAIAGLNPGEREVIELSLRQDFDRDDLASTLGVSPHRARALASRARGQFDKSLGVLLVARSGRSYCGKLDEMLESCDGQLTELERKRLGRHIQHCRVCSGRKRRELQPAMLLSVLPVTAVARGLRQQVLGLAASGAPDVAAYRSGVVQAAGPFGAAGFPAPAGSPQGESRLRPAVLAFGAVAVFAVVCAIVLEFGLHHDHGPQLDAAPLGSQPLSSPQAQAAASSTQAQGQQGSSSPASRTSSAPVTPGVTPTGSVSLLVPPAGTTRPAGRIPPPPRTSSPPPPRTTSPAPPPTTPPTQTPGTLSVSPTSVTLGVSTGGGASSGSFTLTADGGAVSYSISVPSAYAGELTVSPSGGSLASGASVTISVTWNSTAALQTGLSIAPDGSVAVSYQPPTGGASAPPAVLAQDQVSNLGILRS